MWSWLTIGIGRPRVQQRNNQQASNQAWRSTRDVVLCMITNKDLLLEKDAFALSKPRKAQGANMPAGATCRCKEGTFLIRYGPEQGEEEETRRLQALAPRPKNLMNE